MVMIVADPRFVPRDRAGGLDPSDQTGGGQSRQHVVDGLPGHFGKIGANRTEDRLRVGMGVGVYRIQHRKPGTGHPKISRAQLLRVIRRRGHGTNIVPFLESVKYSE